MAGRRRRPSQARRASVPRRGRARAPRHSPAAAWRSPRIRPARPPRVVVPPSSRARNYQRAVTGSAHEPSAARAPARRPRLAWRSCSPWSRATCGAPASTPTSSPTAPPRRCATTACSSLIAEKITDEIVLKNEARPARRAADDPVRRVGDRRQPRVHEPVPAGRPRRAPGGLRPRPGHGHADASPTSARCVAAALEQVRPGARAAGRVDAAAWSSSSATSGRSARGSPRARRTGPARSRWSCCAAGRRCSRPARAVAVAPTAAAPSSQLGIGAAVGGLVLVVGATASRASLAIDHVDGPEDRAAAGRGLGRVPRRPPHGGVDPRGLGRGDRRRGRVADPAGRVGEPLRRPAAWVATRAGRARRCGSLRGAALRRGRAARARRARRGAQLAAHARRRLPRLRGRERDPAARLPAAARRARAPSAARRGRRRLLVAGWSRPRLIAVAAVGVFVGAGGTTTAAPPAAACNGHAELCDRPLDRGRAAGDPQLDVGAAARAGSRPSRTGRSPTSSDDGIRGLLIDTHYARPPAERQACAPTSAAATSCSAGRSRTASSPDAVDAALRIRDRLGFAGEGKRGMYLCHSFCELGGTPLGSVLDDIHDFLVANPGEVVVVINQDYVTPEDFVAAVQRRRPGATRLPRADRRRLADAARDDRQRPARRLPRREPRRRGALVPARLQATHGGDAVHVHARSAQLTDPAKLAASCRAEPRPGARAAVPAQPLDQTDPLPLPSNAREVNAYDPLLARARECERIRDHLPNLSR